jgi:hypothetical protein
MVRALLTRAAEPRTLASEEVVQYAIATERARLSIFGFSDGFQPSNQEPDGGTHPPLAGHTCSPDTTIGWRCRMTSLAQVLAATALVWLGRANFRLTFEARDRKAIRRGEVVPRSGVCVPRSGMLRTPPGGSGFEPTHLFAR